MADNLLEAECMRHDLIQNLQSKGGQQAGSPRAIFGVGMSIYFFVLFGVGIIVWKTSFCAFCGHGGGYNTIQKLLYF